MNLLRKKESKEPKNLPEVKSGSEFPIPQEWKEVIKDLSDSINANRMMVEVLADATRTKQKRLWTLIKTLYPQLDEWACNFDNENQIIKVLFKEPKNF